MVQDYGIDDGVVRWVGNWLSGRISEGVDRGSCVWLGVAVAEWRSSIRGQCQRPVLFIVFIDNIPDEGIRSTVLKFADETTVEKSGFRSEEDRERLRQDLIDVV